MSDASVFKATPLSGWLTYLSAAAMLLSAGVLVSQAYSVTLDVKPGDGVSQRIVGPQAMLLFDVSHSLPPSLLQPPPLSHPKAVSYNPC